MTGCPCCTGDATLDPHELCEDCFISNLEGDRCHPVKADSEIQALAGLAKHYPVVIAPVRHEHGRLWPSSPEAMPGSTSCDLCRPGIPCWRHGRPHLVLVGFPVDIPGDPFFRAECVAHPGRESVGIAIPDDPVRGGSPACCSECVVDWIGAEVAS